MLGNQQVAPKTVLSFILVAISAIASAILAALLFSRVDEYWKISGMLVGVYTGGTPTFIGPVAERLKNREVIVPGLTCGLVWYARTPVSGVPDLSKGDLSFLSHRVFHQ